MTHRFHLICPICLLLSCTGPSRRYFLFLSSFKEVMGLTGVISRLVTRVVFVGECDLWKTQHPLPQAGWGHSLSVSVKASEVPRHRGKNTEWSPCLFVLSCTNQSPRVGSAVTAFLRSSHQTLKSISKRRKREHYTNNLCQMFKLPSSAKMRPLTN